MAGKQDGLRQPNSSINTPTPKKIREKYTQINNLLHRYGALVKNDAKRIEKVAQNMRELDEKNGTEVNQMTKMNYMELYGFMLATNQGLNSRRDLLRKTQKEPKCFCKW